MRTTRSRILGLAVHDRTVLLAELRGSSAKPVLACVGRFDFPEGMGLDEPQPLGAALGQYLRQTGFTARQCVVGLPAAWIMSKTQEVPPAEPEALLGIVRLKAELAFTSDARELAVDYLPPPRDHADQVLLVATLRRRIDQVTALGKAAGLRIQAITCSASALALAAGSDADHGQLTLHLSPDAAEISLRDGDQVRLIRPLSMPGPSQADGGDALMRDIRRTLAAAGNAGRAQQLRIWESIGLGAGPSDELGCALNVTSTHRGGIDELVHANGTLAGRPDANAYAGAVALAKAGIHRQLRPIDFLHSRLAAPVRRHWAQRYRYPAVATAVLLAIAGGIAIHYHSVDAEIALQEQEYRLQAPRLREAEALVTKVRTADGWFGNRPGVLDALRELTVSYPDSRIWATEFVLREDMGGSIVGRARDNQAVLAMRDRLQASAAFDDVKLLSMREAGTGQSDLIYTISFRYMGTASH
jgi:hypothetical protein